MKNLVAKLLDKEEATRPSIHQVLQYPYVKKYLEELVKSQGIFCEINIYIGRHEVSGEMLKRTITARQAQMKSIAKSQMTEEMSKLDLRKEKSTPELSAKEKIVVRKEEARHKEIERLNQAARENAGHLYDAKQKKYNELNEQSPAAQNMYPAHPYMGPTVIAQPMHGGPMKPQTEQHWFKRGSQAAVPTQVGTTVDFQFGEDTIDDEINRDQVEIHPSRPPPPNQYYNPFNAPPPQPNVYGNQPPPLVGPTDPGHTGYNIPQMNLGHNPQGFGFQMYHAPEESKDFQFDTEDFNFSVC